MIRYSERALKREFLAFIDWLLEKRRSGFRFAEARLSDAQVDSIVADLQKRWPPARHDSGFNALYTNFTGLINSAINAVKRKYPRADEDDLRSATWEGFRDAIQSYRVGGGAQFSTFLYNGLIRAMENVVPTSETIYTPTSAKAEGQAILRYIELEKQKENGRTPSIQKIVKEMIRQHHEYQQAHHQALTDGGWNEKKVLERLDAVRGTKSLNEVLPGSGDDEEDRHLIDVIQSLEERPDQRLEDEEFASYLKRKANTLKILPKGAEIYDVFVLKLGASILGDEYDKTLEKYKIPDDTTPIVDIKPDFSDKKMTGQDLYNRGQAEKSMWIAAITGIGDSQGTTVTNRFNAALDFFKKEIALHMGRKARASRRELRGAGSLYTKSDDIRAFVTWLKQKMVKSLTDENFDVLVKEYGHLDSDFISDNWDEIVEALQRAGIATGWGEPVFTASREARRTRRSLRAQKLVRV